MSNTIVSSCSQIELLDERRGDLLKQHNAAVDELVSDLEFMDIPVLRMRALWCRPDAEVGGLVHVYEQWDRFKNEEPVFRRLEAHATCSWFCDKPGVMRWTRGHNRIGFRMIGKYEVAARTLGDDRWKLDEELVLIPESSLQKRHQTKEIS